MLTSILIKSFLLLLKLRVRDCGLQNESWWEWDVGVQGPTDTDASLV